MDKSYILFKTYEYPHQADLDLIKLKSEGLDAYTTDNNMVSLAPFYAQAVGGIKIYVAEENLERAREILSGEEVHDDELREIFKGEAFEPAVRCPNCHSPDIFQERSILSGLFFLVTFFLPVSVAKNKYHCANCDHSWKPQ